MKTILSSLPLIGLAVFLFFYFYPLNCIVCTFKISDTSRFLTQVTEGFNLVAYYDPADEITGWHQVHPAILSMVPLELTEKFSFIPLEQRRHAMIDVRRSGSRQPIPAQVILILHQPETLGRRLGRWAIVGFPGLQEENGAHLIKDYQARFLDEEVVQELLQRTGIEISEPTRYEINDADSETFYEKYPEPDPHDENDFDLGFPGSPPMPPEFALRAAPG